MKNKIRNIFTVLLIIVLFQDTSYAGVTPNDYTFVDGVIWMQTSPVIFTSSETNKCGNNFTLGNKIDITCGFTALNSNAHFTSLYGSSIKVDLIKVSNNTRTTIFTGNPGELNQVVYSVTPGLSDASGYKFSFTYYFCPNDPGQSQTYSVTSATFIVGINPVFISPLNNAIDIDINPTFEWNINPDVTNYWFILIDKDALPSWPGVSCSTSSSNGATFEKKNITESTYSPTSDGFTLKYDTNYQIKLWSTQSGKYFATVINFRTRSKTIKYKNIGFYAPQNVTPNESNPNNYINSQIPVRFKTSVLNELTQNLPALTSTLTSSTTGITIPDNTVVFSNITPGGTMWSSDEFEILINNTVAPGTIAEFELSSSDQIVSGGPWIDNFTIPICPLSIDANILVSDDNNLDSKGNGNSIAEPGETIEILPKLSNLTALGFDYVSATIIAPNDYITVFDNIAGATGTIEKTRLYKYSGAGQETITANELAVTPNGFYVFTIDNDALIQELKFDFIITATYNGIELKWNSPITINTGKGTGDVSVPIVSVQEPADNNIDKTLNAELKLTFAEPVKGVAGKFITIYKKSDNSVLSQIDASEFENSYNSAITFTHPDFAYDTEYYIMIDQGAFKDKAYNEFAGITDNTEWSFTTLKVSPVFKVSETNLFFENTVNSTKNIIVTSNTAWNVTSIPDWLSVNPTSGTETATVAISILTTNAAATERIDTILISTATLSEKVIIKQAGTIAAQLSISVDTVYLYASKSSTGTFNIVSNTSWTISNTNDWFIVNLNSGNQNQTISVTAISANPLQVSRTGKIVIKAGNIEKELMVKQFGTAPGEKPTIDFLPLEVKSTSKIFLAFSEKLRMPDDTELNNNNILTVLTFQSLNKTGTDVLFEANINSDKTLITITPNSGLQVAGQYILSLQALENYSNIQTEKFEKTFTVMQGNAVEYVADKKITIFPNPTTGTMIIETKELNANNISIEITNSIGQIVYKNPKASLEKEQIDLSGQASGLYFINIQTENYYETVKLVKK